MRPYLYVRVNDEILVDDRRAYQKEVDICWVIGMTKRKLRRGDQMKIFLSVFFVLIFSGCASYGTKFEMQDVDAFRQGITTYEQAVQRLGKPNSQHFQADGARAVTWLYITATMGVRESRSVGVLFDREGKMVRILSKAE